MKSKPCFHSAARAPLYPNAADATYFTAKALEILTALLSGTGAVAGPGRRGDRRRKSR